MRFKTTLESAGKTATGFRVPPDVVASLGKGKRPPVVVTIKGYSYRNTVAVYGDEYLIGVAAEHRAGAGVKAGDELDVDLELDTAPREVDVPEDSRRSPRGRARRKAVLRVAVLQQQAPDHAVDRRRQGARDAPAPDRHIDRAPQRWANLTRSPAPRWRHATLIRPAGFASPTTPWRAGARRAGSGSH